MPVILPRRRYAEWLDPTEHNTDRLKALLVPFDVERMTACPVSRVVNSPGHDSPDCIEPIS
jgi:putative SOS response-associated peptidase YedK